MPGIPLLNKATIVRVTSSGWPDPTRTVVCQFNPEDLHLHWGIDWNEQKAIGEDTPKLSFAGGRSENLTLKLLFDTTDTGIDVRLKYALLFSIAGVDPILKNWKSHKSEPSACQFIWGLFLSFRAVIKEIDQTFKLFKSDGTPLRAEVNVTFGRVRVQFGLQNPTSRTEPRKTWVVHEGDRLDWIAYREYGDAALWRHIAATNNLANPQDLRPGQVLQLVPLP